MIVQRFAVLSTILVTAATLRAGELKLPSAVLERTGPVTAIYRTIGQATGKGTLQIHWTDTYDRVVEDRTLPIELTDENEIRFSLDMRRAVAMQNVVKVHLSFAGANKKNEPDHREEDAEVRFIAKPPDRNWWDYMVIMWQDGSADHFKALEKVGVNAGKSNESSTLLPNSLLKDDLRWYVENMATDFYSEYHRYRKDRPYNWSLLEAKQLYKENPGNLEGLKRKPSFSDPVWLNKIQERLHNATEVYSPYRPLFYNLADETGIAELAGFWDFDFSDHALEAMRFWLKEKYGTLAALNQQWGTKFPRWDLVTPAQTRDAMKQSDENYSSWADHKEFMDISFAAALKTGADAVHSVDPDAYVGIEGAQMPGWGGYDYARLTAALDLMEPYDIGDNIEIIRSLNPKLAFVTTAFAKGPWEKHRVWHELLNGARGQIIWDEKDDIALPDGSVGPRGKDVAPYWTELRSGVGAQLIQSTQQAQAIGIHYSQASMRTAWMLEQRSKGDAWMDRLSSTERKNNDFLRLRDSYCRLLEDEGMQYRFVAYDQVAAGELSKGAYRVFILPASSSLSVDEARAIVNFVHSGGILIVDGEAGTFDEHSRRLKQSSLAELMNGNVGKGRVVKMNALGYDRDRVLGKEAGLHDEMKAILQSAAVLPNFRAVGADGNPVAGLEVHEYRNGALTMVALENNPPIEVDELGPLKVQSQKRFEKSQNVRLVMPHAAFVYDVRKGRAIGSLHETAIDVDPYEPTILALSASKIPPLRLVVPERAERQHLAHISVAVGEASPAAKQIFHLEVFDPSGNLVPYYSGNLLGQNGATEKTIPFAQNDVTGKWRLKVRDVLSGQEQTSSLEVF
jgi:hypothetical protein